MWKVADGNRMDKINSVLQKIAGQIWHFVNEILALQTL